MVLYSVSAGTSVEQLFVAGFVPGLLGAAGMMLVAYIFARRYNFPAEEAFNLARPKRTFIEALPTFSLPVIILGGIFRSEERRVGKEGVSTCRSLLSTYH